MSSFPLQKLVLLDISWMNSWTEFILISEPISLLQRQDPKIFPHFEWLSFKKIGKYEANKMEIDLVYYLA